MASQVSIAQTFMKFVDWCCMRNMPVEECAADASDVDAYPMLELVAVNLEIIDGYQPINILV